MNKPQNYLRADSDGRVSAVVHVKDTCLCGWKAPVGIAIGFPETATLPTSMIIMFRCPSCNAEFELELELGRIETGR